MPDFDQPVHEGEDVVARHAEGMLEAGVFQPRDEVGGDGGLGHGPRMDGRAMTVKLAREVLRTAEIV